MSSDPSPQNKIALGDLVVPFALPTLCGKLLVLYFGVNYTNSPGEGYGYGLAGAILFTLFMFGRFLWKYRHYKE